LIPGASSWFEAFSFVKNLIKKKEAVSMFSPLLLEIFFDKIMGSSNYFDKKISFNYNG